MDHRIMESDSLMKARMFKSVSDSILYTNVVHFFWWFLYNSDLLLTYYPIFRMLDESFAEYFHSIATESIHYV